MKDDYLVKLTDGNFVCTMCGCIVHGSLTESHIFNHKLIRLILFQHPNLIRELELDKKETE